MRPGRLIRVPEEFEFGYAACASRHAMKFFVMMKARLSKADK
jgi:hypothetical protein